MRWTKPLVLNTFITLLTGLDKDRFYAFDELAVVFGCPREDIERIVDALCDITVVQPDECGDGSSLPIVRDDDGITLCGRLHTGVDRPVRLDAMQMMAVLLALRMSGITFDDERVAVFSQAAGASDVATLASLIDADTAPYPARFVDTLARGALDECCVQVRYKGTERVFEPQVLIWENDVKYVEGWCRTREAMRTLRLDTIEEIELLETEPARHIRSDATGRVYRFENASYTVRLYFVDPTDYIPAQWPSGRVRRTVHTGISVDVPYEKPEWIARQIVSHLGTVKIEDAPTALREAVHAYAASLVS